MKGVLHLGCMIFITLLLIFSIPVAMFGTGFYFGKVYGERSSYEQWFKVWKSSNDQFQQNIQDAKRNLGRE